MEAAATAETVGKETEAPMMSKSLAAAVVAATAETAVLVATKTAAAVADTVETAVMVPLRPNPLVEAAEEVFLPTEETEEL